jgi:hypothetical protein
MTCALFGEVARLVSTVRASATMEGRLNAEVHCHRPEGLAVRLESLNCECSGLEIRNQPRGALRTDIQRKPLKSSPSARSFKYSMPSLA